MPSVIVVGAQWGNEGKGKIIDLLTAQAKHTVRAQGGNNAGHSVIIGREEYRLYLIPSGIFHPHTQCYIGAGTVIDPEVLVFEINALESRGISVKDRLKISPAAHVIFPYHRKLDIALELRKGVLAVGTTGRGIGPCYADKAQRLGIRIVEMLEPELFAKMLKTVLTLKNEELYKVHDTAKLSYDEIYSEYTRYGNILRPYIGNVEEIVHGAINSGENVLLEGSQGTFLDNTLGSYPYVTSSCTVAGGLCTGIGIGPSLIDHTLGVLQAYTTRLGLGPLPSEIKEEHPFTDTYDPRDSSSPTRRKKRVGWFDAMLAKTAVRLNGFDSIALTKLDVLDKLPTIKICVGYELNGTRVQNLPYLSEELDKVKPIYETLTGWLHSISNITSYEQLPKETREYLKRIEEICGVPISLISVGPEREQILVQQNPFSTTRRR